MILCTKIYFIFVFGAHLVCFDALIHLPIYPKMDFISQFF